MPQLWHLQLDMLVFGLLWLPSDQLRWLGSSCQMKKPCRKRLSSQKVRGSRLPVNLSAEWSTWHKNDPQRIDAKEICVVWNSPPPPSQKKIGSKISDCFRTPTVSFSLPKNVQLSFETSASPNLVLAKPNLGTPNFRRFWQRFWNKKSQTDRVL